MSNVLIFADNKVFRNDTSAGLDNNFRSVRSAGSYRIASEVRKRNLTCQVVEMMTDFTISEIEIICHKFISSDTVIVGFNTSFWQMNKREIIERITKIIECTRDINHKTKIIFGGPNSMPLLTSNNFDIDAVFLGYAEPNFIVYLEALINGKSVPFANRTYNKTRIYEFVEKSPVFNFCQSQIIYDANDFLIPGEPVVIEVGRGCIFKCKFCGYPLTGKKKLDYIKDPDILIEELTRNYYNFGIDKYVISDDTFNDSPEKIKILHEIITKLPFKIYFSCYLRLDLLNAHRFEIDLLQEMGLTGANFGVETFHEQAARAIGKGMVNRVAKQLLYDLKTQHWKNRVKVQIGLIAGLPYETIDSYNETERWIRDEEQCLVEKINCSTLRLQDPKTITIPWLSEFEKNPEKYGYYWPNPKMPDFWKNSISPVTSISMANGINSKINRAINESGRTTQGGFSMFSIFPKTQFFSNKKTFEEQLAMNRFEYLKWFLSEKDSAKQLYEKNYRNNVLR